MNVTGYLPVAGWLRTYPRSWVRFDIIAGLTTAAVVVPKVMATAAIAGLPIEMGLYTALVPMAVYVAMGMSRGALRLRLSGVWEALP